MAVSPRDGEFVTLADDGDDPISPLLTTMTDTNPSETNNVEELRRQLAEQQRLVNELLTQNRGGMIGVAPMIVPPVLSATTLSTNATATAPKTDEEFARELAAMEESRSASLLDADYDLSVAREMQQLEIMMAAQEQERQRNQEPEPVVMEDPVWGKFTAPPAGFKPHQILCISMCPCFVGPYCSDDRKAKYKTLSRTACFVLSVLQFALVVASLCFEGMAPASENPMLGPPGQVLDQLGAKDTPRIAYSYQLWRLITPIFLHAGFVHLLTNLIMQLRLAIFLELKWGVKRFLFIYFASGILSSLYSAVCIPQSIGVGASGALMGVMGAWFVDILAEWGDGEQHQQQQRAFQLVMCFINMMVILGFSFVPMIDWAAHAFGMVGGLLLNMFLESGKFQGRKRVVMKYSGVGLYTSLIVIGFAVLFTIVKHSEKTYNFCLAIEAQWGGITCN